MGIGHSVTGTPHFEKTKVKTSFVSVQKLWDYDGLLTLLERLKNSTLNFSLDKVKFARLLQLPSSQELLIDDWFRDFSVDKATEVVDGLEFLSAAILLNSKVDVAKKSFLIFLLFDLDRSNLIRKDEFTIFLRAVSTGLHRSVEGMPPPASVLELSALSAEYFASLGKTALLQQDFLMWVTEAHAALCYLSVLSRLPAVFAWGANSRQQLGLHAAWHTTPSPVLSFDGMRVTSIASGEFHCLFLMAEGTLWSCGAGFCGLLGHGDVLDRSKPQRIESLEHARVTDVAVGVRHSVAVSEKGQVFTWGSADFGQLGHGSPEDAEVHKIVHDARTGGSFSYVATPTVVMGLFGQRQQVKAASCCSFSTAVLTKEGHIFTWGVNHDGQCGQGRQCSDHALLYLDAHLEQTATLTLQHPKRLVVPLLAHDEEAGKLQVSSTIFKTLTCGGSHMMAVDSTDRLWTWGQGLWGKLGNGTQDNTYEPRLVEDLQYQVCRGAAAGVHHSLCLVALYKLTIPESTSLALPGLPLGRLPVADSPLALVAAPLLEMKFSFDKPILNSSYPAGDVQESIVMFDRAPVPGTYLKLNTSDCSFAVKMSRDGSPIKDMASTGGPVIFKEYRSDSTDNKWYYFPNCDGKVCVLEAPALEAASAGAVDARQQMHAMQLELQEVVKQLSKDKALACIFILPSGVPPFSLQAASTDAATELKLIPFGFIGYEQGTELQKLATSESASATLVEIPQDDSLLRLEAITRLSPKGIIICQQSERSDPELEGVSLDKLKVPVAIVSAEASDQLKAAANAKSRISMEVSNSSGVFAWGDGTKGQLGLGDMTNKDSILRGIERFTDEEHSFAARPRYVSKLHGHEVESITCGAHHSLALGQGKVFSWGSDTSQGLPRQACHEPMPVGQLESTVNAKKAFAGHDNSFVIAEMPYKSLF
eukprot:TRINITY_DN32798_c0_g1_i1.p1 TRINITY_DN32798_c0_g1~~TRINITY_DN32798_c0_g1_i1.p1  ORF type:complete len:948 (-),score=166.06 TRINITY_DN32798_c0_g1_i1:146-2938(-)